MLILFELLQNEPQNNYIEFIEVLSLIRIRDVLIALRNNEATLSKFIPHGFLYY